MLDHVLISEASLNMTLTLVFLQALFMANCIFWIVSQVA